MTLKEWLKIMEDEGYESFKRYANKDMDIIIPIRK